MTNLIFGQMSGDVKTLRESYENSGIIKLKLFDESQILDFRNSIISKLYQEYCLRTKASTCTVDIFEKDILPFFEFEHKELWNGIYRNIMMSKELYGLISNLFELPFGQLFGIKHATLCNSPNLKINLKNDESHLVNTHQDFQSHFCSLNAITIWIPLQSMTKLLGPIEYLSGSHKKGVMPSKSGLLTDVFDDSAFINEEMKLGDCLVFSQLLIHRSGINKSDTARLSCQIRFSDFNDQEWRDRNFMTVERKSRVPLSEDASQKFLVS